MILNENTIKVGSTLYYLNILQKKDYHVWYFTITTAKITSIDKNGSGYYYVVYKIPLANTLISQDGLEYECMRGHLWNDNLLGNKRPIVKLKECKGRYQNEWAFFCDSFKDLIQALKETVFSGKGNEATKRKREKMYRELVKRWTKSDYRENFFTRIE